MNIFEVASRNKLRFRFKGVISVEDLWDLELENLDSIYKDLNSRLKKTQEESLLNTKTKTNEDLETKVEIVKHVFNTKLEQMKNRLKAKEIKEQKQRIMEIINSKKDAALENKKIEELESMLNNLGD